MRSPGPTRGRALPMEPNPPRINLEHLDPERFARLKAILEEVMDLPSEQVAPALDRLCADDPELRAEADLLLAADRALHVPSDPAAEFLASRHLGPERIPDAGGAGATREISLTEDLAGTRAGPYKILREIGRGGMGRVYLAERADGQFEQTVAIKILKRGLDTDEVLQRFLRERQILARLEHPNIARLLDGGATEDGRPFLAMELVQG